MNVLSTRWFSDQEMEENNIIQQNHMNSIVGEVHEAHFTFPHSFTSLDINNTINNDCKNDPSYDDLVEIKPSNILNNTYISPKFPPPPPLPYFSSNPQLHYLPSSRILSFENVTEHECPPLSINSIINAKSKDEMPRNLMNELISSGIDLKRFKSAQPLHRSQSNAQAHTISERKRREKLTERFAALSTLIPGLKKLDKASVLGEAFNHIKYLQERVRKFEEEKKERRFDSMVIVKKSKLILDGNNQSSSSFSSSGSSGLDLPEIEVVFLDKDVLIKILCEKQKGHIAKIMAEIEKFRFSIINSSVLPFGPTLDITITAQKENDFDMTLMDVVKSLRASLSKFM